MRTEYGKTNASSATCERALQKAHIDVGLHDKLLTCLKSFPPAPGAEFKTNPMLWNFTRVDTWWHGEPDCEVTLGLARSMISSEFLQDHPIQCRCVSEATVVENTHMSMLMHGPGQQRSLGACVALIAYITAMADHPHLNEDDFTHPLVTKSISSLMAIPTIMSTSRGSDLIDRMVMAAAQNRDAKVQPVNSWSWFQMLKPFGCTAKHAVDQYNGLPEVAAHAGGDPDLFSELHIDHKRLYAIDGWLREASTPVHDMMTTMLRIESWVNIMLSDKILCNPWMWVGSTADFAATTASAETPMPNEDSTCIDWSLPMSEDGHLAVMTRLRNDFRRSSMLVAPADKKNIGRKSTKLKSCGMAWCCLHN